MKNKKAFEFNFALIFAIIAGAAILVLAVYGAMRVGNTQRNVIDTEIAKKISIITDPLQAGFAEGSYGKITFTSETKINNKCFSDEFGKNEISVSTKSGVGEEWQEFGGASSLHDKYIFSENTQGKEFYVFSKQFNFPFKISDLIFLSSEKYCFVSSPYEIENELNGLGIENIEVFDNINNCSENSKTVCFDYGNCDVVVHGTCISSCENDYDEGYIVKDNENIDYVSSLMYAAIFSDKDIYECNVKRLLYRTSKIADIFSDKIDLMSARNCNSNLKPDLIVFSSLTENADSSDLIQLNQIAKDIDYKENLEACGLWS